MGLHTGSAQERDDNYFGPVLNRAARIMATGSGGQVLVSATTAAFLASEPAELHDLGVHRLRDLLAPEHVYQLVIDGDEGAYPPLRTLEHVDNNLPTVRSSLHGREDDVEALRQELRRPGLITLTGAGGVGKTRLALEVAAREIDGFDGAFFVDLAVVTDPEQVPAAFLSALGIETNVGADAITRMLRSRSSALIIDNCEHVVDVVAELADDICRSCPRCSVLVTSREPLGVDGNVCGASRRSRNRQRSNSSWNTRLRYGPISHSTTGRVRRHSKSCANSTDSRLRWSSRPQEHLISRSARSRRFSTSGSSC